MLNALDRLSGSYVGQIEVTRQELAIAEGQLRDHEARIGRPFPHDGYRAELTGLRDRLKAGLSQATPEPGTDPVSVSELAESIKSLKAAHTINAAPERATAHRIAAEEPVTARIRGRTAAAPAIEPEATSPSAEPAAVAAAQSQPEFRQQIALGRRQKDRQLGLF